MELHPHLITTLASLTEGLDEPGADLQAILEVLVDDLVAAVPSFTGFEIEVLVGGSPVTFGTMTPGWVPGSSLRLSTRGSGTGRPGPVVTFFADGPRAFADLTSGLRALGLPPEALEFDGHQPASGARLAAVLDNLSQVNQAIGVLIACGYLPGEARAELERRAGVRGTTAAVEARLINDDPAAESRRG